MIFASDLDQTLIYSERFIENYTGQVKAVETGKYRSYMTGPAAELLKKIASRAVFVPCTTRTVEQYLRIDFLQTEVKPGYAVVSNGANLLVDGAPDAAYRESMNRAISRECMAGEDILREFGRLSCSRWAEPMREADGVFHYCIVQRERIPLQELDSFSKWACEQKWDVSIQGRKLYLVPRVVNKWSALQRVTEITGEAGVITAGDSLLDYPMIQGADFSISPAHGELFEQYGKPREDWVFTESSGIEAGEEILGTVINLLRSFKK